MSRVPLARGLPDHVIRDIDHLIRDIKGKLRPAGGNYVVVLARRTAQDFIADDCPHLAAAIAYYGLFSLFPLLLGLIAILGFVLDSPSLYAGLATAVANYLPGAQELITGNLQQVVQAREEAGAVAVLGLLWSATAVFGAVRKALNTAWDLERSRPLLQQKLLDLAMVGGVGGLFVLSIALTATYRLLRQWELPLLGMQLFGQESLRAVGASVLPPVLTFSIFLVLYRVVPNTSVAWTSALLGAVLASVLFEVAKNLFVWYAQTFGRYELVYGALGTVIGLLTWVYLSALILLMGAELAAEHGKMKNELAQATQGYEA